MMSRNPSFTRGGASFTRSDSFTRGYPRRRVDSYQDRVVTFARSYDDDTISLSTYHTANERGCGRPCDEGFLLGLIADIGDGFRDLDNLIKCGVREHDPTKTTGGGGSSRRGKQKFGSKSRGSKNNATTTTTAAANATCATMWIGDSKIKLQMPTVDCSHYSCADYSQCGERDSRYRNHNYNADDYYDGRYSYNERRGKAFGRSRSAERGGGVLRSSSFSSYHAASMKRTSSASSLYSMGGSSTRSTKSKSKIKMSIKSLGRPFRRKNHDDATLHMGPSADDDIRDAPEPPPLFGPGVALVRQTSEKLATEARQAADAAASEAQRVQDAAAAKAQRITDAASVNAQRAAETTQSAMNTASSIGQMIVDDQVKIAEGKLKAVEQSLYEANEYLTVSARNIYEEHKRAAEAKQKAVEEQRLQNIKLANERLANELASTHVSLPSPPSEESEDSLLIAQSSSIEVDCEGSTISTDHFRIILPCSSEDNKGARDMVESQSIEIAYDKATKTARPVGDGKESLEVDKGKDEEETENDSALSFSTSSYGMVSPTSSNLSYQSNGDLKPNLEGDTQNVTPSNSTSEAAEKQEDGAESVDSYMMLLNIEQQSVGGYSVESHDWNMEPENPMNADARHVEFDYDDVKLGLDLHMEPLIKMIDGDDQSVEIELRYCESDSTCGSVTSAE